MPTLIRTVEEFDCRLPFGYVKSPWLRTVIQKLRLYHENIENPAVRDHMLFELRDAVMNWAGYDPQFTLRNGPDLELEVKAELASRRPEPLKLIEGDILFRWVPEHFYQRGTEQRVISAFQHKQDDMHGFVYNWPIMMENSASRVVHVGIYADPDVIEMGLSGLRKRPVAEREHYDLVVRSGH